jgi:proton glutamate symport protein
MESSSQASTTPATVAPNKPSASNRKLTLTHWIFMALGLGLAVGHFFPSFAVSIQPLSTLFLHLIKMMVAPLLFATLVIGIAGAGDAKKIGRMGLTTILYFEIATTFALAIGLWVANWLKPGAHAGMSVQQLSASSTNALAEVTKNAQHLQDQNFLDHLVQMAPTSVVEAMAQNNILQLVVFAVFFALALMDSKEAGKPILNGLEALAEVMFKFVGKVMVFAPMGVFAATAASIGKNGIGILGTYAYLIGAVYLALLLFIVLTLLPACTLARIPFLKLLQTVRAPFLLAFSTASSESALPQAMTAMERFGVPRRVVSFVMPTGYSFNLDGSTLYLALASLFVAQIYGIELSWKDQLLMMLTLMLTSKGVAAVPRASLVILAGTLASFKLPVEGIGIILGVDQLLDMARTSINLLGNCVASAVVARVEGCFDQAKMEAFDPATLEAETLSPGASVLSSKEALTVAATHATSADRLSSTVQGVLHEGRSMLSNPS